MRGALAARSDWLTYVSRASLTLGYHFHTPRINKTNKEDPSSALYECTSNVHAQFEYSHERNTILTCFHKARYMQTYSLLARK